MPVPEPSEVAVAPLWRNRNFRLLFSAQIISLLGSGVTTVGLALFAYQLTGGVSATAVDRVRVSIGGFEDSITPGRESVRCQSHESHQAWPSCSGCFFNGLRIAEIASGL